MVEHTSEHSASGGLPRHPLWKDAIDRLEIIDLIPGKLITYEWLYAAFGLERPEPDTLLAEAQATQLHFLSAFKAFETALLSEKQIALANVRGKGYRIVAPNEQTAWAEEAAVEGFKREAARLRDRLTNVDMVRLNDRERRENTDAQNRLAMLTGLHRKLTVEMRGKLAGPDDEEPDSGGH